jgi:hypothetical protein
VIAAPCVALAVSALALSGCALQVTSGPSWANERHPAPIVVGGTLESQRASGGTFGARVGMAMENGLVPKQGIIHAGYDIRAVPGWVVVEPRLDLGLGGPIASAYSGVGAYVGGGASVRLRVYGVNDEETAFNVIGLRCDVLLSARAGAWTPPEGATSTRVVGEYATELGVRVALTTDIHSGPPGAVQPPRLGTATSEAAP